ncbi:acetylglutamate kinase [Aeribacillus composti]|jgi:acetylglutamate kinase|uniref:acetylglutamate kinase n=1 Tax=Aeribacillus composti TaxID=1868734 RepID=UPI002E20482E|nr:acetylglutamate kinase [Aeribacillus composti]MED0744613.1 acetylglutamate kinase [Aeribacillus composti]
MSMSKSMQVTGHDKPIVVIKLGGSMLEQLSESFLDSIKELLTTKRVIIVHGGGPDINNMLTKLNVKSEFYNGMRKTTKEVLEIAEMVLSGKINKQLTALLTKKNVKAIGLSGTDGQLIVSSFLDEENLGFVGKVEQINDELLRSLLILDYVPVIAPIGITADGQKLNINADLAASAIAEKINAEQLLFVTNVPGILHDGKLIEEATETMIEKLIEQKVIYGGMIPKVQAALDALSDQLEHVMIVSGNDRIFKEGKMIGTKITKKREVVVK